MANNVKGVGWRSSKVCRHKLLLDDLYGYGYWALADGARRDLLNEGSDNLVEQAHTVLSSSLTQPQPFKLLRPALHGTQGYHHRTGIHSDRKICAQKALRLGWDVSRPPLSCKVLSTACGDHEAHWVPQARHTGIQVHNLAGETGKDRTTVIPLSRQLNTC